MLVEDIPAYVVLSQVAESWMPKCARVRNANQKDLKVVFFCEEYLEMKTLVCAG